MAKTLKNIQAIQNMLAGTRRTQTKTTIGFSDAASTGIKNATHAVGDTWVDEHGTEWEQKEGYRVSKSKFDDVRAYLQKFQLPTVCPKCNKEMKKNRYNKKMWAIHKMCFDCTIDMEHELILEGKFEEYQNTRIKANIESWLKDVRSEVEVIKQSLTEDKSFVNYDGTLEWWKAPYRDNKEELYAMVEAEFKELETKLLAYGT